MTLRCRPGDLAVVVAGSSTGLFVTVLERGPDHPLYHWPTWFTHCLGTCKVTMVNLHTGEIHGHDLAPHGSLVLFCDRELKPIRPPPVNELDKTPLEEAS